MINNQDFKKVESLDLTELVLKFDKFEAELRNRNYI
jgi:hypothetical protein